MNRPAAVPLRKGKAGKPGKAAEPRLSRQRRPEAMDAADWQRALRRQFGREQSFELQNLGSEPVFSDFRVHNPATLSNYRVAVRGLQPGDNFCTCPDYATNDLGTCKHVEFTLGKLLARRGGKAAFARGYAPTFSEIWLQYGVQRRLRLRAGSACPATLAARGHRLFGADDELRDAALAALNDFIASADSRGHELRVHDDALAFVAQL